MNTWSLLVIPPLSAIFVFLSPNKNVVTKTTT